MKSSSRLAILSTVVVAILALLYVMPAFASDSKTTTTLGSDNLSVGVYAGNTTLTTVGNSATVTTDAKDTKVGNTIFVASGTASGDTKYNQVLVQIRDATLDTTSARDTITVSVKNLTTGSAINGTTISMGESANDDGYFQGKFTVATTGTIAGSVVATDGDVIRIDYAASGLTQDLTVDAVKPTISSAAPATGAIQITTSAVFSAEVTDLGSGLRGDTAGEVGGADVDGDGVTAEPITNAAGRSSDIGVFIGLATASTVTDFGHATDSAGLASTGWTAITNGYSFSFTKSGLTAGTTFWRVKAQDRVGNARLTDVDGTAATSDAYTITIDSADPQVGLAEAGIGYNTTTNKEKSDRKSIKLVFSAGGATPTNANADKLDSSTLGVEDFRVDVSTKDATQLTVASVIHPNIVSTATTPSKNLAGSAFDTRNVVYLVLEADLLSSSKPNVKVINTVRDLSGRASPPHSKAAVDKIKPALTVTATGETAARPIVVGSSTKKITIRVVSDEALNAPPSIYLVNFDYDETTDLSTEVKNVSAVLTPTAVAGADNTWETTTSATSTFANSLVGIHVVATDKATPANTGTNAGVTQATAGLPAANEVVDLNKIVLFEFDDDLDAPSFTLTPNTGVVTSTESTSPFVRIDFTEANEFPIKESDGTTSAGTKLGDSFSYAVTNSPSVAVEIDSHDTVTLTKLEQVDENGASVDLLGTQGVVDDDSVVVALSGLTVGTYTIKVNATDEVGNKLAADSSYSFKVVARSAYSIALSPGFNLVSLPGDPADASLDAVLPSTHPATAVLAYAPNDANGPWLTATKTSGGNWSDNAANTLTEMTAGNGYWVQTGAFTPLKTLIPQRDPSKVLPTYPVVAGWNLIGVVDLTLRAPGVSTVVADAYLASIAWTVSYTFDTQANSWTKITKKATVPALGAGSDLINGQGVWVWSEKKDVLAP